MELPEKGVIFKAKIDRISNAGNGIIETDSGHINIGPVSQNWVGKQVEAKRITDRFARCLTGSAKKKNYDSGFDRMILGKGGPTEMSGDPNTRTMSGSFSTELGGSLDRALRFLDEKRVAADETHGGNQNDEDEVTARNLGHVSSDENGSVSDEFDDRELRPSQRGRDIPQDRTEDNQNTQSTQPERTSLKNKQHLRTLRNQAYQDAVDNVPHETITQNQPSHQYNRSHKIREYVLNRADGVCEGCGEAAPFISKTGEPYLHAHHIQELSDGGSDSPDTVIALCPNCHFRVHHGEDGVEYNQYLEGVVEKIEENW